MEKLNKVKKELIKNGLIVSEISLVNGDRISPALRVEHDYIGAYPTEEALNACNLSRKISEKYGCRAQSRGFYTATFITV